MIKKIELKNLIKRFNKDFNIINDVSLTFNLDKPCVVLGEEGSGKTTLLNILCGLDLDYEGGVFIDGTERRDIKLTQRKISYIPAEPVVFNNKSVYKNLEYAIRVNSGKKDKKKEREIIKQLAQEYSIADLLTKKFKRCSLYNKKLVQLIRAVIKRPELIVFDEPFCGLSLYEKTTLWQRVVCDMSKLSCGVVVAENGQNNILFNDCYIVGMSGGAIF